MTDEEIGALQPGQVLLDRNDREWRVLHEPKRDDSTGSWWVMLGSGDLGRKLTSRNADYRLKPG